MRLDANGAIPLHHQAEMSRKFLEAVAKVKLEKGVQIVPFIEKKKRIPRDELQAKVACANASATVNLPGLPTNSTPVYEATGLAIMWMDECGISSSAVLQTLAYSIYLWNTGQEELGEVKSIPPKDLYWLDYCTYTPDPYSELTGITPKEYYRQVRQEAAAFKKEFEDWMVKNGYPNPEPYRDRASSGKGNASEQYEWLVQRSINRWSLGQIRIASQLGSTELQYGSRTKSQVVPSVSLAAITKATQRLKENLELHWK